jgi:hypothetical protein
MVNPIPRPETTLGAPAAHQNSTRKPRCERRRGGNAPARPCASDHRSLNVCAAGRVGRASTHVEVGSSAACRPALSTSLELHTARGYALPTTGNFPRGTSSVFLSLNCETCGTRTMPLFQDNFSCMSRLKFHSIPFAFSTPCSRGSSSEMQHGPAQLKSIHRKEAACSFSLAARQRPFTLANR